MKKGKLPPTAMGSDDWPGLAKLVEECGELVQVAGKIIAYPDGKHPDGKGSLAERLMEEMADVSAALNFVLGHNEKEIDHKDYAKRLAQKTKRFNAWHNKEKK